MAAGPYYIADEETLDRPELEALQRKKLAAMLARVLPGNGFYRRKFEGIKFDPMTDPMSVLPFTTRGELEADQQANPPYGTNLSFPMEQYCRLHQTSGTGGRPLRWLDTAENWEWWKRLWGIIFAAAGVNDQDRIFFPFSFGPFVGFWGAFDAAVALKRFVIAAGGMTTTARLKMIIDNHASVICCTPTYALHMTDTAAVEGIDISQTAAKAFIVAGEPGGHIAATRQRIESAWGARVFDHTGMTEIGPLGFECEQNAADVHITETDCIAEVLDPKTDQPVGDGELGELVVTNLGRVGSPVIRYRTNDQVVVSRDRCACGRWFMRMRGGILGRIDDMFSIRGNNVFPAAIEAVVRRFEDVAEFGVEVNQSGSLAKVRLKLEPKPAVKNVEELAERVGRAMNDALSFKAEIEIVPCGSLPRFEMKARRYVKRVS